MFEKSEFWQSRRAQIWSSKAAPKQLNLNKLGDAGGFKCGDADAAKNRQFNHERYDYRINDFSGGDREGDTPDPIPNSEVKLLVADGTCHKR